MVGVPTGWREVNQRLQLPPEHPDRPHVGWHWFVAGVRQDSDDLLAAARAAQAGEGFLWCGLRDPDDAMMAAFTELLGLHELAAEDAVEGHTRSKLEVFDEALFMVISTVDYVPHESLADTSEIVSTGQVMVYLGPWFVLTARHGGKAFMNTLRHDLEADPESLAEGPWRVLYQVLDRVIDSFTETTAEFESDVEEIEDAIFAPGTRPDVDRVYNLKRELIEFKRCVFPLAGPLQRLQLGQRVPNIPEASWAYFREVSDHLVATKESTMALDEVLGTMIQAALARISLEDNQDMRRISAAVAMFVVPTLIGSIYGMNFENMPELHSPWGYYGALGAMVGSILLLALFFRRKGWL